MKNIIETSLHEIKTDTGFKIKVLRTDNDLKFANKEIKVVLLKYWISHQTTVKFYPRKTGRLNKITAKQTVVARSTKDYVPYKNH